MHSYKFRIFTLIFLITFLFYQSNAQCDQTCSFGALSCDPDISTPATGIRCKCNPGQIGWLCNHALTITTPMLESNGAYMLSTIDITITPEITSIDIGNNAPYAYHYFLELEAVNLPIDLNNPQSTLIPLSTTGDVIHSSFATLEEMDYRLSIQISYHSSNNYVQQTPVTQYI